MARHFKDKIIEGDCIEELKKLADGSVDLVFADPPYAYKLAGKVISQLITAELPAGTIVVVEHSAREAHSALPVPTWRRKIGETYLSRWEA